MGMEEGHTTTHVTNLQQNRHTVPHTYIYYVHGSVHIAHYKLCYIAKFMALNFSIFDLEAACVSFTDRESN